MQDPERSDAGSWGWSLAQLKSVIRTVFNLLPYGVR